MATGALDELQAVAQAVRERDGLMTQAALARTRAEQQRARLAEVQARLTAEQADVRKLESFSMTRILAGLSGRRDADLDRERAEVQAAEYAVAREQAGLHRDETEVASLESRIQAYGDLATRHRQALDAREAEVRADTSATVSHQRLTELAAEAGRRQGEIVELGQAVEAARAADRALAQAQQLLGDADGWATYDTFFGGGMISDVVKYDKLDAAARVMRQADAALGVLAQELADVGIGAVGEVGISSMTRTFDVFFDNIFSDWAVKSRIQEAAGRVHHLRQGVAQTGRELDRRTAEARGALDALARERAGLLETGSR